MITPLYVLVCKFEEVTIKLSEALTFDSNIDPGLLAQIKRPEDIQEEPRQAELTASN